ncbi:MAG: hypothetical protein WD449_01370 [Candidatus Babeliales bacterium]
MERNGISIFIGIILLNCSLLVQNFCQLITCCRGAQKDCLRVACPAGMPTHSCCYWLDKRGFVGFLGGNCPRSSELSILGD